MPSQGLGSPHLLPRCDSRGFHGQSRSHGVLLVPEGHVLIPPMTARGRGLLATPLQRTGPRGDGPDKPRLRGTLGFMPREAPPQQRPAKRPPTQVLSLRLPRRLTGGRPGPTPVCGVRQTLRPQPPPPAPHFSGGPGRVGLGEGGPAMTFHSLSAHLCAP